jgi:hypothetical protein
MERAWAKMLGAKPGMHVPMEHAAIHAKPLEIREGIPNVWWQHSPNPGELRA